MFTSVILQPRVIAKAFGSKMYTTTKIITNGAVSILILAIRQNSGASDLHVIKAVLVCVVLHGLTSASIAADVRTEYNPLRVGTITTYAVIEGRYTGTYQRAIVRARKAKLDRKMTYAVTLAGESFELGEQVHKWVCGPNSCLNDLFDGLPQRLPSGTKTVQIEEYRGDLPDLRTERLITSHIARCTVRNHVYRECLTIREGTTANERPNAIVKEVTFARHIGPIRFAFFKSGGELKPFRTEELVRIDTTRRSHFLPPYHEISVDQGASWPGGILTEAIVAQQEGGDTPTDPTRAAALAAIGATYWPLNAGRLSRYAVTDFAAGGTLTIISQWSPDYDVALAAPWTDVDRHHVTMTKSGRGGEGAGLFRGQEDTECGLDRIGRRCGGVDHPFFTYPLAVGVKHKETRIDAHSISEVVAIEPSCRVRERDYADCLTMRYEVGWTDDRLWTLRETITFAAGLGPVRWSVFYEDESLDEPGWMIELISTDPPYSPAASSPRP